MKPPLQLEPAQVASRESDANSCADGHQRARFVRAEVNLLRLPLFALQTRGLRQLDGFECRGTISRNGQSHEYFWRVTRHATRSFPGPLARTAHLGLLSILREDKTPVENPVTWSWRDLCRRIGVTCSGRTVSRLKEAIRATAGVLIESRHCIYSKTEDDFLELAEDDRRLYTRVHFHTRKNAQRGYSDRNSVWLARWYLDNLNRFYTAPLDHELWRYLNRKSPIASRVYEYVIPNMYRPGPCLRINYPLFAQSLPVRTERYYCDARKQIGPALELLAETDVLAKATWAKKETSVAQISLYRGNRLASALDPGAPGVQTSGEPSEELLEVRPLHDRKPPEARLVVEFHRHRWGRGLYRPSPKEVAFARQLIRQFGENKARALIPFLADQLKARWPDAKTFVGAERYVPEASDDYDRKRERAARRRQRRLDEDRQEQERQQQQASRRTFEAKWQAAWNALPPEKQQAIRTKLAAENPALRKMPSVWHSKCLQHLARQADQDD